MGTDGDTRNARAIERLRALDRVADPALQSLARLAAKVTSSSSAAVHILDDDQQHRIAGYEAELAPHPREDSMCRLVIEAGDTITTADATKDERFSYSSFIAGPTPVRFYASAPMRTTDGAIIGTVCAFDGEAMELSDEDQSLLEEIAIQASTYLELTSLVAELGAAASEDALTGLANRLILNDRLAHHLARRERGDTRLLVAAVDLDGFKQINDIHGHAAGDQVLREVAARLSGCMRGEDTVARLGGDEFVVLAELEASGPSLEQLTERLRACVGAPMELETSVIIQPSATIGGVFAEPGEEPDAVLERADQAMYALKRADRSRERP